MHSNFNVEKHQFSSDLNFRITEALSALPYAQKMKQVPNLMLGEASIFNACGKESKDRYYAQKIKI